MALQTHSWGDSVNVDKSYPSTPHVPLSTLDQLINKTDNRAWLQSHVGELKPAFISFYRKLSTDSDSSSSPSGVFDYFSTAEDLVEFIKEFRGHQIADYINPEQFSNYHIYKVFWTTGTANSASLKLITQQDSQPASVIDSAPRMLDITEVISLSNGTIEAVDQDNSTSNMTLTSAERQILFPDADNTTDTATNTPANPELCRFIDTHGPYYDPLICYSGERIKTHKLQVFGYFDLYQNYLAKFDKAEQVERCLTEIKEFIETAKPSEDDMRLDRFLIKVEQLYSYCRQLVVAKLATHRNNMSSESIRVIETYLTEWTQTGCQQLIDKLNITGDSLLDLEGYLGTGLFLVHYDPHDRQTVILPTLGDRGHILPEPGFSLVKKYGLAYFLNSEISGFQISHLRKLYVKNLRTGDYDFCDRNAPVYLECSADTELDYDMAEVVIDDVYLYGLLTDYYV